MQIGDISCPFLSKSMSALPPEDGYRRMEVVPPTSEEYCRSIEQRIDTATSGDQLATIRIELPIFLEHGTLNGDQVRQSQALLTTKAREQLFTGIRELCPNLGTPSACGLGIHVSESEQQDGNPLIHVTTCRKNCADCVRGLLNSTSANLTHGDMEKMSELRILAVAGGVQVSKKVTSFES